MTDDQRLALFQGVFRYVMELEELPEGTALDIRGFIEPTIERIVDSEVEKLKQEIRDFVGSAKTVGVDDLLKLLEK